MWDQNINALKLQTFWPGVYTDSMLGNQLQRNNKQIFVKEKQNLEQISFYQGQGQQEKVTVKLQKSLNEKEQIIIQKEQDQFSCSSQEDCDNQSVSKKKASGKGLEKKKQNRYKKYSRITPQIRQKLINLIAKQNMSIKKASQKLKINYSSAKFIFSQHRDKKLQSIDKALENDKIFNQQFSVKIVKLNQKIPNNHLNILLKCSSGGKFEAESSKVYAIQDICRLYHYPFRAINHKKQVQQ